MFSPVRIMAAVLLVAPGPSLASPTPYDATVMTYNLWNYIGTNTTDNAREDDLAAVIHSVAPDILVVQEINGTQGYTHFLDDVLNTEDPDRYEGVPFINQDSTDADIALYYDPDIFQFLSTQEIELTSEYGHRDGVEVVLKHLPTGTKLNIYGVHLKAGSGFFDPSDEEEREAEASKLRDYLNGLDSGTVFLVAGDLNVYHSDEGAFLRLTESQEDNDGRLFDPLNQPGEWHDNAGFADVHTQSSRGGEYGGLDDRFDFILASFAIMDTNDVNVIPGSYTAYGNDGNHLNQAVNDGTNSAVSAELADALVEASDHLPVTMKLRILGAEPSPYRVVINEIMKNPRRVPDGLGEWFELFNTDTVTINLCGWTIVDWGEDRFRVECEAESLRVSPHDYLVLGPNGDTTSNGGAPVDYEYHPDPTFQLDNGSDQILLFDASGREVDRVEYDDGQDFPDPDGASMALLDATQDNNVGANWTVSTQPYGDGDLGTPGESNSGTAMTDEPPVAHNFRLRSWPNPFNAATTVSFILPHASPVRLRIVDLKGREVATLAQGWMERGGYEILWNAGRHASGIYLCRLEAGGLTRTRKLVLVK